MKVSDIEKLKRDGFVTEEQAAQIIAQYGIGADTRRRRVVLLLSLLAGALILSGIIMLIAANWESIPDLVKMSVGVALLIAFWVGYFRTCKKHPLVAELLSFLGGGMWIADVSLYGQIFQLQNPPVEGLFCFWLGLVSLPLLVRSRLLMAGVAVLTLALLLCMLDTYPRESCLGLKDMVPFEIGFWLLFYYPLLVWLVCEHLYKSKGFASAYAWMAVPAKLMFISVLSGIVVDSYPDFSVWMATPFIPLMLLLKPKGAPWLGWCAMSVFPVVLIVTAATFSEGSPSDIWKLVKVASSFAYGASLMFCGGAALRSAWVNYGTLLIVISGFLLATEFVESLTDSGLTLIAMGLLLLIGGYFLFRQNRAVMNRIKNAQVTTKEVS